MNDNAKCELIEKLRKYVYRYGLELSGENLSAVGASLVEVNREFAGMEEIADAILARERVCFEEIFEEYNFDGWNAIDIMLLVGNEIYERFFHVSPSVTFKLAAPFPRLFDAHLTERSDFIYEKIKINIEKGMKQGMYKNDVSSEMVARMYIAKLNDIHDNKIYPPEGFNFATIFNHLIDDVIRTITNEEGWRYYKQRKQFYTVLNFNR
ncbi:MAG: hypothetical protein LBD64_00355 [Odoribacteraceae bacterium]|jgi:hypothetical protein|nr:hypothetical protein [Odoribacteraceae bacterium]